MNRIHMELVQTIYDYGEYYWMIDGRPIVRYLNEAVSAGACPRLEVFGSLEGLLPAWTGELVWKAENRFIWEMVDSVEDLNVPVLVCEDDCDLSCIVIMAKIRKEPDTVYWDSLGVLNLENQDFRMEKQSGILCLEAYSDQDWEEYGDNIACEQFDSPEYRKWVSEHWDEEMIRRRRNYTKPYMQRKISPGYALPCGSLNGRNTNAWWRITGRYMRTGWEGIEPWSRTVLFGGGGKNLLNFRILKIR